MKFMSLGLLALAGGLLVSTTPAQAQFWHPINQRQRNLDDRIDAGVRNGDLTRLEANRLRMEFRSIANLEGQYRRSGGRLTQSERSDLDRRFDALSRRVYAERRDWQERRSNPWQPINQRQRNLDSRIDAGVRSGELTRLEANRLRMEFRSIANLEARYRRSGGRLTLSERSDLDRRFDNLSGRIYAERRDWQERRSSPWQSINQRQRNLDARIDAGVRSGDLTWAEAIRLRSEFRGLANLEARYRQSGGQLTLGERSDLDRRFDGLSRRIRVERADRQNW